MVWYSHLYKNFPQFVVIHPIKCFGVVNKAAADTTERLQFHFSLLCIEEGSGNPLQCSCLENPKDGGACWAAVCGSHRVRHNWRDLAAAAAADVFLELCCFFDDPADVGNLISGSSAFSKSSLNIWKFLVPVLLNPGFENFEHYFASLWDECSCSLVWTFWSVVLTSTGYYLCMPMYNILNKNYLFQGYIALLLM